MTSRPSPETRAHVQTTGHNMEGIQGNKYLTGIAKKQVGLCRTGIGNHQQKHAGGQSVAIKTRQKNGRHIEQSIWASSVNTGLRMLRDNLTHEKGTKGTNRKIENAKNVC